MRKLLFVLMISALLVFAISPAALAEKDQPITIGLLPDEKTEVLLERFEPVQDRLEKTLKRPVKVVVPSLEAVYTYDDLVDQFVNGKVQVAYFGGLSFIRAFSRTPTVPLAMRKKDTKFRSYFIARSEHKFRSLHDLKGVKFTFGSISSTSGHLMPRYFLKKNGIDPEKDFDGPPQFSGAHDKTLEWVVSGRVDAGALNSAVFDQLLREGKIDPEQVEVVWITPGYPDYIWAARKDVPMEIRDKIVKFFLNLTPGIEEDDIVLKSRMSDYYVSPDLKTYDKLKHIAEELGLISSSAQRKKKP